MHFFRTIVSNSFLLKNEIQLNFHYKIISNTFLLKNICDYLPFKGKFQRFHLEKKKCSDGSIRRMKKKFFLAEK